MSIEHLLKKEGISNIEKLPTIKTNLISNNIANKLCEIFPEHNFDKQNLFVNLSRLNMYTADIPYTSSMAKYVSQNQSIYFNRSMNLEDLDTIAIHECLHYIQESNAKAQNNNRLGIAILGKEGMALNEAAVQLMASEANKEKEDIVTYYNLTLPTTSPTYYTLECALLKQITYFTGTYPLYHSTIYSNDIFKNTFIQKTNKRIYRIIEKNFNKLVELQDILSDLTNELQYSNANDAKIKNINTSVNTKKEEIFNLFLKTQNIIMTNCFNVEFKSIKTIEDLKSFKSRVYNYQFLIATNKDYTFYKDFFYYTMNKIEQKEAELEKNGYVILPGDRETALALFEEKPSIFALIAKFFNKLKKVSQLESLSNERTKDN